MSLFLYLKIEARCLYIESRGRLARDISSKSSFGGEILYFHISLAKILELDS